MAIHAAHKPRVPAVRFWFNKKSAFSQCFQNHGVIDAALLHSEACMLRENEIGGRLGRQSNVRFQLEQGQF